MLLCICRHCLLPLRLIGGTFPPEALLTTAAALYGLCEAAHADVLWLLPSRMSLFLFCLFLPLSSALHLRI